MVVSSLITKFRLLAVAVSACGFTVAPAYANSANADIAAPLRAAQAAKPSPLGNGDAQFRQLFASWRSLDKSPALVASRSVVAPVSPIAAVSIPSRVPLENFVMTSSFGMREHPILGGEHAHKGVDLAAPVGTPVYAPADGTVARANWFSSYGLYIQIEHGGNIETRYGHLSRVAVAAGQQVHKGDLIGFVGTTGRSTGPHLHYEVRVGGQAVNPVPYMQAAVTSVPTAPAAQLALAGNGAD